MQRCRPSAIDSAARGGGDRASLSGYRMARRVGADREVLRPPAARQGFGFNTGGALNGMGGGRFGAELMAAAPAPVATA